MGVHLSPLLLECLKKNWRGEDVGGLGLLSAGDEPQNILLLLGISYLHLLQSDFLNPGLPRRVVWGDWV